MHGGHRATRLPFRSSATDKDKPHAVQNAEIDNVTALSLLESGSRNTALRYNGTLSADLERQRRVQPGAATHFDESAFGKHSVITDRTKPNRGNFRAIGLGVVELTEGTTYRLTVDTSKQVSLFGTHTFGLVTIMSWLSSQAAVVTLVHYSPFPRLMPSRLTAHQALPAPASPALWAGDESWLQFIHSSASCTHLSTVECLMWAVGELYLQGRGRSAVRFRRQGKLSCRLCAGHMALQPLRHRPCLASLGARTNHWRDVPARLRVDVKPKPHGRVGATPRRHSGIHSDAGQLRSSIISVGSRVTSR